MVVHRQQAEEVVVVLGHRLARPVLVRRTDLELLVVPAELHEPSSSASTWESNPAGSTSPSDVRLVGGPDRLTGPANPTSPADRAHRPHRSAAHLRPASTS